MPLTVCWQPGFKRKGPLKRQIGQGLPSYDRAMDGSYEGNAGAIAQATPWPTN